MKRRNLLSSEQQNVTKVYNHESDDVLYTVAEVAKLIRSNPAYVYGLINRGLLPALKLGSMKIRKVALLEFLEKYEGYDLTDLHEVKKLEF